MSNKINLLLIALLFQFIPTSVIAAGKHALLIGIQDYSKTKFNSLAGPANDLKLTETVLRQRFGFQDNDFIIIKDNMATHTGIIKAFKYLINRVQPNDFVYIFYSGHGSHTKDLNGDERSGNDQTWVSYAARTSLARKIDNYDVLDDEINAWLAALYEKTKQVVFVSDSCHSATVSRSDELVRAVKEDKRQHLLGKRRYRRLTKHHGIRVGATRDKDFAIDFPQINGKYYGLFTWYWLQNLQQAQAGETWNDVFKRTYVQVTQRRGIVQQPQMSGNRSKVVLGGGFTPLPSRIPVSVAYRRWVGIQAGALAGVTKGSVYHLYRPSNPRNLPSLTITKVTAFKSYGKPKGTFKKGDLVVEKSHAYHFPPLKVYLEADKSLLKPIRAIFATKALSAYQLNNNSHNIDLRLYLSRSKSEFNLSVQTIEQRLFNNKLKIKFDKLKNGIKWLQSTLRKMARARELILLQSRSTLPITVQISILTPACSNRADCMRISKKWYHKTGPYGLEELQGHSLNQGQILTFSLSNQTKTDYYVYLMNITPDFAIRTIFPAPWETMEFARINQGETRQLRTGLGLKPIGEETLKLITSNKPIDMYLFEQEPVKGRLRGRGLNPLEQILVNVAHGQRGESLIEIDKWATGQVSFKVGVKK